MKILLKNTSALTLFPFLLVSYEMTVALNNDAYLPALPQIMKNLSTTHHLAQLTLSMWFLGYAILQLFIGPMADRFGSRKILLTGSIITIIATLGCALKNIVPRAPFAPYF